jgi:hypothetical protein
VRISPLFEGTLRAVPDRYREGGNISLQKSSSWKIGVSAFL